MDKRRKEFIVPEIVLIEFATEDVIATSLTDQGVGGEISTEGGDPFVG